MSNKLDKIGASRDYALQRRDAWDAKYQELDRQYKETEAQEIQDIVRQFHVTPDQLAQLLQAMNGGAPVPVLTDIPEKEAPVVEAVASEITDTLEMEDIIDEA